MGQRDVWVALGRSSFTRADTITKISASDHYLRVKVSGEREDHFIDLGRHGGVPADWSEEDRECTSREPVGRVGSRAA